MHNNSLLLNRFAKFLNQGLEKVRLVDCVSTSSNDIHFKFSNDTYLLIRFHKQHTFFLNPELSHFPKKNALAQFKVLTTQKILFIKPYVNDRGFYFKFGNTYELHVHCFGRRSALLLARNGQVEDSFKNLNPESEFIPEQRNLVFSTDSELFRQSNRFISPETVSDLKNKGFFTSNDQQQFWDNYLQDLKSSPIRIYKNAKDLYGLSLYQHEEEVETYSDIRQAYHDFARLYLGKDRFDSLQSKLNNEVNRGVSASQKGIKKVEDNLQRLTTRVDFKQIADVLMANLYHIPEKSTEVNLLNFYTNEEITISLKKNLSPQKNAERYYQKSKNSHLEIKHSENQLKSLKTKLESFLQQRQRIEESTSTRELQQMDNVTVKREKKKTEDKQLPYRQFQKGDFEIWVGKSAKSNDALLKLAHKNDVWLHARGVAGSHVLIKNREDNVVPEVVLEYAASLAAKYSKNQHDTLAAVMYTSPKYVRKFKGALPGQVRVDREEVILIEPLK